MKTTSQATINAVAELFAIIEQRKALEKAEKALKSDIKAVMGSALNLDAGLYAVIISERSRSDLDKTALEHDMGHDFIVKYSKRTSYEILEVKPAKRQAQEA